jgi:excisionase family DNA binding protein
VIKVKGRPRNEEIRKIFCEVVQGITYSDRCLFKLAKVLEGNKSCENCILREIEKIRSGGSKRTHSSAEKRIRPKSKEPRQIKKKISPTCIHRIPEEEAEPLTKQSYSIRDLVNLLGKPERTIRKWAEKGKIPAHKVGKKWRFSKEKIDRWLSEQKGDAIGIPEIEDEQNILGDEDQGPQADPIET